MITTTTVLNNVAAWRRTHRVTPTPSEVVQRENAAAAARQRRERWQIRNGRLVSIAQAFACAKAA